MELLEMLLALALTFGLLAVGWRLFGRITAPAGSGAPVYAVVWAVGDGAGLEQDVNGLLWMAAGKLPRMQVVIVNGGLTPMGSRRAELLSGRPEVLVCRPEELAELVRT